MDDESRITPVQRKALLAAWLGWAFDGLDGYLYIMVAGRFVGELLTVNGVPPSEQAVLEKASIIQAVFLVGWAVGGAVFGRLGDRLGRCRTLTLTILTYAIFTGLSFFAQTWWHLLIFRFVAALGIGGEWAAGSALVSETLHPRHRSWASALLQSGYMVGCILAALTAGWMKALDPRWVFVIGVLPALLVLWIRRAVPEPESWQKEAGQRELPPVSALFSRELRWTTLSTLLLTSIALTTVWAFLFFVPQVVKATPEAQGWDKAMVQAEASRLAIVYLSVNIGANFVATYLARWAGYRAAMFVLMAGAGLSFWFCFREQPTLGGLYVGACLAALTGLGLFGIFPLYIPPLFPTLVRTLGAGFTYNFGRLVAAGGTFYLGAFAAQAGGPSRAIAWVGLLYIAGLAMALVMPVPKEAK